MSRAEQIRDYLRQCGAVSPDGAVTRAQISRAVGMTGVQLSPCINDLKRQNFVATVGEIGSRRYYSTGKVAHVPMHPAELRAREVERQARRRRKAGQMPRAEYEALCAQERAAKLEASKVKRAAAEKERNRRRSEQRRKDRAVVRAQAIVAQMRVPKKPRVVMGGLDKHGPGKSSIAQPKTAEAWPSVEDFIKAGGVIQVLRNGEVSQPFRAIGFNRSVA